MGSFFLPAKLFFWDAFNLIQFESEGMSFHRYRIQGQGTRKFPDDPIAYRAEDR